jgi:hypothetical protein
LLEFLEILKGDLMSEPARSVSQPSVINQTSPSTQSETQRPSIDQSASSITFGEDSETSFWQGYLPSCVWECVQHIIQFISGFWQSTSPSSPEIPENSPLPRRLITKELILGLLREWGNESYADSFAYPCKVYMGIKAFAESSEVMSSCWNFPGFSYKNALLYSASINGMINVRFDIDEDDLTRATRVELVCIGFSASENPQTCQYVLEEKIIEGGRLVSNKQFLATDCPLNVPFDETCHSSVLKGKINLQDLFDSEGKLKI